MALDPLNLSDTILDSWDSHSDKILSNDQFKDELEKEKQEKAELQEMLGTNRYAPDIFNCDNKYFLPHTAPPPTHHHHLQVTQDLATFDIYRFACISNTSNLGEKKGKSQNLTGSFEYQRLLKVYFIIYAHK